MPFRKPHKRPAESKRGANKPQTPAEVTDFARRHGAEAVKILLHIARHSENDTARIAACRALLDRGGNRSMEASLSPIQTHEERLEEIEQCLRSTQQHRHQ